MRNSLQAVFRYRSPSQRGERGADVFETAMVLPVILLLMMGLFVFARGWDIYQSMTRAAREGVRQAVTTSCATCGNSYDSNTYIQDHVVFPALKDVGLNTSDALLNSTYAQGYAWLDQSQKVCGAYVMFKYPYTIKLPFLPLDVATINLSTRVQMRLESDASDGSCPP